MLLKKRYILGRGFFVIFVRLRGYVSYSDGNPGMVTRKLRPQDRDFLKRLGKRIERIIIEERGYSSLDAFSIECNDLIAKPTLYQICQGKRDMKLSTLRGLAAALEVSAAELIAELA